LRQKQRNNRKYFCFQYLINLDKNKEHLHQKAYFLLVFFKEKALVEHNKVQGRVVVINHHPFPTSDSSVGHEL